MQLQIDIDRWYGIEEISHMAYLATGSIDRDIRRGRLIATKVPHKPSGKYLVRGSDLQAWLSKPRPSAGRPWGKHDD